MFSGVLMAKKVDDGITTEKPHDCIIEAVCLLRLAKTR